MQIQRQMAANPQTMPNNLGCESAIHTHHIAISPKADTQFTLPQRVEG